VARRQAGVGVAAKRPSHRELALGDLHVLELKEGDGVLLADPEKVVAMFNIEMIGTESKWGRNSAYITGYEKTDMGQILDRNLEGTGFKFYPDPYPQQNLFYRSDNATLARLGVPAHTISTSKMDSEKYYHTQEDEIETLDMNNMAEIIKAIAISATSIIAGKDTPTRVNAKQLAN